MSSYDSIVMGTGLALAGTRSQWSSGTWSAGPASTAGCTPTKEMAASADAAQLARRAGEYGVSVGGAISVDMARVKARRGAIVAKSLQGRT